MNEPNQTPQPALRQGQSPRIISTRKLIVQVVGFLIGLALLVWCIVLAVREGGWSKLTDADPWLIAGMIGFSLLSFVVNGIIFWWVIQPIQPTIRIRDMIWLTFVSNVLNITPIRAGLIARVAYNMRVDKLSLLQIGGWMAAVGVTLVLALGACVFSTIIRPSFDWLWFVLTAGQIVLGGFMIRACMSHPLVVRMGKGMDQMLSRPGPLWGSLLLRLVDIAAFAGRMACAVAIMGFRLSIADILILALTTLAANINPLGRVGYREVAVAFVAARLISADLTGEQISGQLFQLALIESAGEALVAIPLGAIALIWYSKRWKAASRNDTPQSN